VWDKWVIDGDLTVVEFTAAIQRELGLVVDGLTIGTTLVAASFLPASAFEGYANRRISDIYVTDAGLKLHEGRSLLSVHPLLATADGKESGPTPPIYLKWR
jgi:hypothetical protein